MLRKAAILIASLDRRDADELLAQMPPAQAAKVRAAAAEIKDVDPRERQQIIGEFLRRRAPQEDSGVELDGALAQKLSAGPESYEPVRPPEKAPFQFLRDANPETLHQFLRDEHPQTIAFVVAQLTPERAAQFVVRLAPDLQADVLVRVAELDEADTDVQRDIAAQLESALSTQLQHERRRTAGLATVAAILQATQRTDRDGLIHALAARDVGFVTRLRSDESPRPARPKPEPQTPAPETPVRVVKPAPPQPRPEPERVRVEPRPAPVVTPVPEPPKAARSTDFTFDDLTQLDDGGLATTFRALAPQVALLALTGAPRGLVDRIRAQLPRRDANELQRRLAQVGPLRLSDVQEAQQEAADVAADLIARGLVRPAARRRFTVAA